MWPKWNILFLKTAFGSHFAKCRLTALRCLCFPGTSRWLWWPGAAVSRWRRWTKPSYAPSSARRDCEAPRVTWPGRASLRSAFWRGPWHRPAPTTSTLSSVRTSPKRTTSPERPVGAARTGKGGAHRCRPPPGAALNTWGGTSRGGENTQPIELEWRYRSILTVLCKRDRTEMVYFDSMPNLNIAMHRWCQIPKRSRCLYCLSEYVAYFVQMKYYLFMKRHKIKGDE